MSVSSYKSQLTAQTIWPIDRVKDHALKIGSGVTPSGGSASYLDSGVPLLRSQNIHFDGLRLDDVAYISDETHDEMDGTKLHAHDVLLNITGASIGRCTYVPKDLGEANVNQHVCIIRSYGRLHFKYLAYVLGAPWGQDQIFSAFTGASRQGLGQRNLGELQIPLPPLAEQKRIAAYLDASCAAIDRAVESKRKQLETLDALRKSIIQQAVTQGLNPKVKMKDSGTVHLGPVPQHWKVRRVKDVFEFHNHRRIPISSADRGVMTDRIYDYYGASGAIDKVEDFIFEGRYILLAEDGANLLSRSKPLAFFAEGQFWVNNHAHIIKPWRGNEIYWVNLLEAQDYSLAVTGSAQPKLNMQNFGRFQIPVPPVAEQNEIADFVVRRSAECDKVKDTLTAQITTLTAYRKSLIHECVTGKRRISEEDVAKVNAHV